MKVLHSPRQMKVIGVKEKESGQDAVNTSM